MADVTYDVHVDRIFAAPPDRVWRAWTDPADLRVWWGPQGFTCPRADVDARVGGRILVTMQAPEQWGGAMYHNSWTITELEPGHRLRYLSDFTDAAGNRITPAEAGIPAEGVPIGGEHEVVLIDLGDGRTRMEMTEHGYTLEAARDMSKQGLEQSLDKMAALVEQG